MQVCVGPYKQNIVQTVQDFSNMEVEDLVAVFTEDINTKPWIARVENINENLMTVGWWESSYKTRWKASFARDLQKSKTDTMD